ncbi:helix-turn-helix domain-containing protein [Streptomyces daliensis]|uniref:Helix-turn-helix transcriptional regulator n=1 Tax=Streptomyces daliensis TaxID=299421 RepID=A0A8T4IYQ2_9ACTN|nr:helix-turn-helix transcriptional regulator [Streptomyces daliensis]
MTAQKAGGVGGSPEIARTRLAQCLKALYEEARRVRGRAISYKSVAEKIGISTSGLGNWLNGNTGPAPQNVSVYWALIDYLEERARRPSRSRREWQRLVQDAVVESQTNRGGRPPNKSRPAKAAPFRYFHTADQYLPPELVGREEHLDQLPEMIRTATGYLALVAPPWAGKSAFLATFVRTYETDDMDLIAYFVRRGHRSDNAADYSTTMVEQLRLHVGGKHPCQADAATLLALYKDAAQTSIDRGRTLLLVVDGLDEDAGARIGSSESIASLLPRQPHPGLRVLVSRRWHPPLPGDVPRDHPLRRAEQVPRFRPSPEAGVLRETVLNDLAALFRDTREWVHDILGYLTLATGGLSQADLVELLGQDGKTPTPRRFSLTDLLHSVVSRGFGPEDLEPDTFVLAHEELYGAAEEELGPQKLAELTRRLHRWADSYRADGWPDSTPVYLLHHYQELLRQGGDFDRWLAFALDHRRLLCLANRGRTDLALASLDHVGQVRPTPVALASAAASRSLLEVKSRPVPREVLRALVVVGDFARARSLALSPADPASKAVRLMEVVQAALSTGTPGAAKLAVHLARDAAACAVHVHRQDLVATPTAELEIQALVPRAAAALAAVGLSDEAMRMLTTVDICHLDNVTAVAGTAALLLGPEPAFAGALLDELMLEAECQAESAEGRPVLAVEIWSAVAAADPDRAEPVHHRMKEFAEGLPVVSPGLTAADCCATAASALAEAMPEEARKLAHTARREARKALGDVPGDGLREVLTRVARALLDVGETAGKVRALLSDARTDVASCALLPPDGRLSEAIEGLEAAEAAEAKETEELLKEMKRLSDLGDGPNLRRCLDRFTKRAAEQDAPVTWLPFLAEALFGVLGPVEEAPSLLTAELSDTHLRLRVLASTALAHAGAHRHDEALRCAEHLADVAQRLPAPQPPEARALVAQAFAHAGDAERAVQWAAPPHGGRPLGKAGIPYRRAALAVEMGLEPEAVVARVIADGLPRTGLGASGNALIKVLCDHSAGARPDAQFASLESVAHERLATEPLIATGLALLQATLGDSERACSTIAQLPEPGARGVAQVVVATYLTGVPTYLDVAADEGYWTLSVLRVLAHHMCPAEAGDATVVRSLALEALATDSWYWILPVLGHITPEAVSQVVDVLVQHWTAR